MQRVGWCAHKRTGWAGPAALAVMMVTAVLAPVTASGQIVEAVGSRALGMGGAFVGVANDSSATWWNPGALATGPFLDMGVGRAVTDSSERVPARRDRVSSFAITTPPFGFSYYRLQVTEIRESASIEDDAPGREDEGRILPIRSLSVRQFGATVVQTLLPGVHAGATLKYLRGSLAAADIGSGAETSDLLEVGEDLDRGEVDQSWDLDVGVMAVTGPVRIGGVVRNIREPRFGADSVYGALARLPRQVRIGASFDGAEADILPLTVALDVDVRRYETVSGDRRVVAVGAEQRLFKSRLALRAGGRFNTVGREERAATAGVSVAVRSGLFVDGHIVRGGSEEDRGWGLAARVSF